jgi:putative transposase
LIPLEKRKKMLDAEEKISVLKQCKLLKINRNGFYYHPKIEADENEKIINLLKVQYSITPFYGYRKMTIWLRKQGFLVNEKRVRRLMKSAFWQTIYKAPKTTITNKEHEKYPYLLKDLEITKKNQVWATDITYIPMNKGFMYLTAIIDLHTRMVLNWEVSNAMNADWCAKMLEETIVKYGKPEIFNTDQGSQYTSNVHIKVLKDNDIKISMDGKGRAIDNIFIERLWRSVKYENVYLQAYEDGISLHNGMKRYFDFYNNERFHQSLNYKTPSEMYYQKHVA